MFGKLFLSVAIAAALVVPAVADIASTTGPVDQMTLPSSLDLNQVQSDTAIRLFAEKQGVAIGTGGLTVDTQAIDGRTYDNPADLVAGYIAEGTVVNSYLIHVDPATYSGIRTYPEVSITFGDDILGLMVTTAGLRATDSSLGNYSATTYWWTSVGNANVANRGLELNGQDVFEIAGNTLILNLKAAEAIDEIRVIEAVPVPAALLLGMLGMGVAGLKLRKFV